jgi:hypothetical protein
MNVVGDILLKSLLPKTQASRGIYHKEAQHIEHLKDTFLSQATYEQM